MSRLSLNFKFGGGQSFLALVRHPNLQLFVSAGFHIGYHRGLSHERPIRHCSFVNLFVLFLCPLSEYVQKCL